MRFKIFGLLTVVFLFSLSCKKDEKMTTKLIVVSHVLAANGVNYYPIYGVVIRAVPGDITGSLKTIMDVEALGNRYYGRQMSFDSYVEPGQYTVVVMQEAILADISKQNFSAGVITIQEGETKKINQIFNKPRNANGFVEWAEIP